MSDSLQSAYKDPSSNASGSVNLSAPNLLKHPPRSPRSRLGGFAHLPRLIDKARAVAAGTQGDFHYNCPVDQRFFSFTGIDPEAFMAEVKAGKADGELLAFALAHLSPPRADSQIASWTHWMENLAPTNPDSRGFFNDIHRKNAPNRDDIATWFDWLELDDYVTYGGKP
jgi:Domain of unknown function (DUF5069)